MITPTTTIAELAEILRRNGISLYHVHASADEDAAFVSAHGAHDDDDHVHVCRPDLAAAISAALEKAGAR